MNIKTIVKVMNFHSLLRVDAARKKAEKYAVLGEHITDMMACIMFNRNLILDKRVLIPDERLPELNIYFGSDYGFCGGVNYQANGVLLQEQAAEKVLIGRKLRRAQPHTLLEMSREAFDADYARVEEIVYDAVNNLRYSKINVIYSHYYNTTDIRIEEKCIFPMELSKTRSAASLDDFIIEGNPGELITKLARAYVNYQIKIAAVSCFASENVLRQSTTTQSLKKLEEKEEERENAQRRQRSDRDFKKVIESYTREKGAAR